jgi:hypothetical protein
LRDSRPGVQGRPLSREESRLRKAPEGEMQPHCNFFFQLLSGNKTDCLNPNGRSPFDISLSIIDEQNLLRRYGGPPDGLLVYFGSGFLGAYLVGQNASIKGTNNGKPGMDELIVKGIGVRKETESPSPLQRADQRRNLMIFSKDLIPDGNEPIE